jgi:hypothetical protein
MARTRTGGRSTAIVELCTAMLGAVPNLVLNVSIGDVDIDVYLSVAQACMFAASLVNVAAEVEGTEPQCPDRLSIVRPATLPTGGGPSRYGLRVTGSARGHAALHACQPMFGSYTLIRRTSR